jgi:hypothetical protein
MAYFLFWVRFFAGENEGGRNDSQVRLADRKHNENVRE